MLYLFSLFLVFDSLFLFCFLVLKNVLWDFWFCFVILCIYYKTFVTNLLKSLQKNLSFYPSFFLCKYNFYWLLCNKPNLKWREKKGSHSIIIFFRTNTFLNLFFFCLHYSFLVFVKYTILVPSISFPCRPQKWRHIKSGKWT